MISTSQQALKTAESLSESDRNHLIDNTTVYAETDLLCYWSDVSALQAMQQHYWEPALKALEARYGVPIARTVGVIPVAQKPALMEAVRRDIESLDDLQLIAFGQMVPPLGSVLLALYWWHENPPMEEVVMASQLDETFQSQRWGEDEEAAEKREEKKNKLLEWARIARENS